jgi:predicted nucleic acid-binding protein
MTVLDTDIVSAYLKRDSATRLPALHHFVTQIVQSEGLAISFVTQFELRRGFEELRLRGRGRRLLVAFEKLLDRAEVLGLDGGSGEGWNVAARLWAAGRARKPAVVVTDADLLIAATAEFHGRAFATCEAQLAENPKAMGLRSSVQVVPQA